MGLAEGQSLREAQPTATGKEYLLFNWMFS